MSHITDKTDDVHVVFLIIANNTYEFQRDCMEQWRRWYQVVRRFTKNWEVVLLRYGKPVNFDTDTRTLWCGDSVQETYCPGILNKTLFGMKWCMQQWPHTQFVVRTNLSSVWLPRQLDTILRSAPRQLLYTGWNYGKFISGSGIIMSRDVVLYVCDEALSHPPSENKPDDVEIGRMVSNIVTTRHNIHNTPVCLLEKLEDAGCEFFKDMQCHLCDEILYVRIRRRQRENEGRDFQQIIDRYIVGSIGL